MNRIAERRIFKKTAAPISPFTKTALVLQGGGALGAYQAGVYEVLSEAGYEPHWIAGISIEGINAAIIVGNKPVDRLSHLREFWQWITPQFLTPPPEIGEAGHQSFNRISASILTSSTAVVPLGCHSVPSMFGRRTLSSSTTPSEESLPATSWRALRYHPHSRQSRSKASISGMVGSFPIPHYLTCWVKAPKKTRSCS